MIEFYYVDRYGRELGSVMAFTFADAHRWLAMQDIEYHEVTKFRPRKRKSRDRRLQSAD